MQADPVSLPFRLTRVIKLHTVFAVQCPEPVAYRCTFSLKHLCDDSSTCFTGTVCCFDGCRRRCVPPKGATGTHTLLVRMVTKSYLSLQ